MAAGLGFKDFVTGEVLTAADVDGYLMQNIWVFASTAARDAAVTAPSEGNFAFTKDTDSLWYYNGAAWVASGATGDIEGVTAGTGISGGGTSGTVTITNDMATTITAAGDIVVGTGSGTYDNLPIGTTNQVLTADTTVSPYKVKWAAVSASPASANATVTTSQTTTSTSYTDLATSGPAVTITTGTKALVIVSATLSNSTNSAFMYMDYAVSGSTTRSASDNTAAMFRAASTNDDKRYSAASIITVTAGSNTFTAKYKQSGGTGLAEKREIIVIDLGS